MIKISEDLVQKIEKTLSTLGFKLYYIEQEKFGNDVHLIIYIQKLKHNLLISLEDCVLVTREVNKYIDNYISEDYMLEISSPGINRELHTQEHFQEVIDQKIEVRLRSSVVGIKEKKYYGYLKSINDTELTVDEFVIPFSKIKKVLYVGEDND